MLAKKKILIIAPHPDDESICNGGLIMKAAAQKATVFVLFGAIGYSRQFLTNETNADVRIKELEKAANYGSFRYDIMFQGDEFMRLDSLPQKQLIEKIEDTSHSFQPDIVVIPNRHSFDQDHRALSTACMTAYRPLPQQLRHQSSIILESEEPYTWNEETGFVPNVFIDISDFFEKKIKLLKFHKTQLREDPFPRSPNNLKRLAGMRGCEIGAAYAEGYRLLRGNFL